MHRLGAGLAGRRRLRQLARALAVAGRRAGGRAEQQRGGRVRGHRVEAEEALQALGREVELSDEPLLEVIQVRLAKENYRFSVAVELIVTSEQFRSIRSNWSRERAEK